MVDDCWPPLLSPYRGEYIVLAFCAAWRYFQARQRAFKRARFATVKIARFL